MDFHLEPQTRSYFIATCDGLSNVPHLHRHMEIIYKKKGSSLAICGTKEVLIQAGDLFIAFPNQIHYYLDQPGEHDLILIIASPDLCPEFKHDFKNYLPISPVLSQASAHPKIVAALENILESNTTQDKYSDTEIKGNLMLLLSALLKNMPLEKRKSYDSNLLTNILLYCYDNFTEDVSLHSLSDALQVSPYYISHIFNERLHISFRDYINSLRIEKACELINNKEKSITDIAFEVGYNSIRTFNRSFMKIMKLSPTQYRELSKKTNT